MTVNNLLPKDLPNFCFIKTKEKVWEITEENLKNSFLPDSDFPQFPSSVYGKTQMIPLSVTSFPGVLKRMTAMQAGFWAISKCNQQNWEIDADNIECCLSNLEMDF